MGGQLGKAKTEALPMFQGDSNLQHAAEAQMSSGSSNSQSCDSTMHLVTVFNTIASRVNFRTLSFDSLSLREVIIGSPLVINPADLQCILDSKKPKWINEKLFLLVKDYFHKNFLTLNSSGRALDEWLRRARESHKFLQLAFQHLDKMEDVADENNYLATLEALQDFKAAGNPFTERSFTHDFLAVCNHQVLMFEKLESQEKEYDKKVESVKIWKKVSSIVFASTLAATIIFSAVAAAMAAPHLVAAGAAVTSIPVGTIGMWFNSRWKDCEDALKVWKKLIGSMYAGTYVAIKDLKEIWVTVNLLSMEIETLIECTDSAIRKEAAVKIVVEKIERKLEVFFKRTEDLTNQAEKCSQDIQKAIKVVLGNICTAEENPRYGLLCRLV